MQDDGQLPDEEAEPRSKSGLSSDRLGSSSIKLETDSSQHSDLVAVKARSSCDFSSPLKIRIKQEPVESEGDEDVDVDPSTVRGYFECTEYYLQSAGQRLVNFSFVSS